VATAVEQEHHPQLHHQARPVLARQPRRFGIEALPQAEPIPQASQEQQAGSVREVSGRVTEPQRGGCALHMRSGSDRVRPHRLGSSTPEGLFREERPQRKASGVSRSYPSAILLTRAGSGLK
jgi:hypothetical protein